MVKNSSVGTRNCFPARRSKVNLRLMLPEGRSAVAEHTLRPQVHVDTHEIAAIGDLAEIDHGMVPGREDTTDFGDGRVEGYAKQPRCLEIGGADCKRLTGAGDRGIPEIVEDRDHGLVAKALWRSAKDLLVEIDGNDAVRLLLA